MAHAEGLITLNYDVDPAMVCGGVWVDEAQGFVPVRLTEPYYDEVTGTTLYEYNDRKGNGRACLLSVPAGCTSRTWSITGAAGEVGYYERQQTVAGTGSFDHWSSSIEGEPVAVVTTDLPEAPQRPMSIEPGDTFRVRAGKDLGVHVLAVFPGAPFKLEYEVRVDPPIL